MVVSNAGPLIWLSWAGQFDLLPTLFGRVIIAPAVYAEVVERATGYPNETNVRAACNAGWMEVVSMTDASKVAPLLAELHQGEAATLVLAQEQNADAVLVDDLQTRNFATAMGLRIIGTAGVLLLAREKGLEVDVKAALDSIRGRGFRLSEKVYQDILRRAGQGGSV
jgi:hypothetical protein